MIQDTVLTILEWVSDLKDYSNIKSYIVTQTASPITITVIHFF